MVVAASGRRQPAAAGTAGATTALAQC